MEKVERFVESRPDWSQQHKQLFQLPNQHKFVLISDGKGEMPSGTSSFSTGDTYLWCTAVWKTYICYFVSPCKSSQGLRFLARLHLLPLPTLGTEVVHFLSLSTTCLIRPAAGKQFPDLLPLKKFSLQLLQVHQSAALAKPHSIILIY